jgi:hypothetical protein
MKHQEEDIMQTGRALSKTDKENIEEQAQRRDHMVEERLHIFEERVISELRRMTDRFEKEGFAKGRSGTPEPLRKDEDEFDELVRKATEAFYQGINSADADLQKLVDEVNRAPLDKQYEPLIRNLEERTRDPWREFWAEMLAACIPACLMLFAVYLVFKLEVGQAIFQGLFILGELSVISLFCLVFWVALRSHLMGAETMRGMMGPHWRGALAAGCLIAALIGGGGIYFRHHLNGLWQIAQSYSQELVEQHLTDEAMSRLQGQLITNSFSDDRNTYRNEGAARAGAIIQPDTSSGLSLSNSFIQITEESLDRHEAIISARGLVFQNKLEMKLNPRSGVIYLPEQRSEVLSRVLVGRLKSLKDGNVILKNSANSILLAPSALRIPYESIRNKMVAIAYKPNDPDNQGDTIRRVEKIQILTLSY